MNGNQSDGLGGEINAVNLCS